MCDHHHHHSHNSPSLGFFFTYAGSGWGNSEGKLLILYSSLLGLSSILEVVYGLYTSDSHVVSEGFHTMFHGLCIWAAMIALSYTLNHSHPDKSNSFGYSRAEVVAAFGNSIFSFFIGFFALFEAVHEIVTETISDSNSDLLSMIFIRTIIHSVFFFHLRKHLFDTEKTLSDNLGIVALHCLGLLVTDTTRVFSLYFELECQAYPIYLTESFINILWVLILMAIVKPYLVRNGKILLLCTPTGKQKDLLVKKIREISLIEGVVSVKEEKLWMVNNQDIVGSLKIEVHGEAKNVVNKVKAVLKDSLKFVVIETENSDGNENYS